MNTINELFYIYKYAIAYWLDGQDWKKSKEVARAIVLGFKTPK